MFGRPLSFWHLSWGGYFWWFHWQDTLATWFMKWDAGLAHWTWIWSQRISISVAPAMNHRTTRLDLIGYSIQDESISHRVWDIHGYPAEFISRLCFWFVQRDPCKLFGAQRCIHVHFFITTWPVGLSFASVKMQWHNTVDAWYLCLHEVSWNIGI